MRTVTPTTYVKNASRGRWAGPVSIEDLNEMTALQRDAIKTVQGSRVDKASASCCVGFIGVGAIFGAVICFVSGLLGWLLIMKKVIIQCTACGAVTPAS